MAPEPPRGPDVAWERQKDRLVYPDVGTWQLVVQLICEDYSLPKPASVLGADAGLVSD